MEAMELAEELDELDDELGDRPLLSCTSCPWRSPPDLIPSWSPGCCCPPTPDNSQPRGPDGCLVPAVLLWAHCSGDWPYGKGGWGGTLG